MRRIFFLADDLCSGGAERQMVTLACLLKQRCYDVSVYCYGKADFYADILRRSNVPIIWEYAPNYLKRIIKVRKHIRNNKYDAVISFLPTCNFLNNISAIGGKSWKVITGERSARTSSFTTLRGKLFNWLQRYSDYIVCNSHNAASGWKRYMPEFNDKLRVIYNIVTLGKIDSEYIPKVDGKIHIVVAATYQFLKNPLGLIDALMLMNEEQRENIVIDWYGRKNVGGDCQAYDRSLELIQKYGIGDILHLNADTKDIANIMNKADAVMLLSWVEGLPNVICEAMTIGKPIIMSRVSDYSTLVDDENGFLCDWDKPDTIKEAIVSMANCDCTQLKQMGRASKEKSGKLFSAETVIQQWKNLL